MVMTKKQRTAALVAYAEKLASKHVHPRAFLQGEWREGIECDLCKLVYGEQQP